MEKLLKLAKEVSDQAEIFVFDTKNNSVMFENAKLQKINTTFESGISIRLIKDGKLGFAYTRNLNEPEELIKNALESLEGQVEANYEFPLTETIPELDTFDKGIDDLSNDVLVKESQRLCKIFKAETKAEIVTSAYTYTTKMRILNTKGTDLEQSYSGYGLYANLGYPGSATGISRHYTAKKFQEFPTEIINEMIKFYNLSEKPVQPESGKMKVLFMPGSMGSVLFWRIQSGLNGRSCYEKVSPIADKLDQQVFSEKLTIFDDPLDDKYPGASAFDGEGVAKKKMTVIENGKLKNFYYDLKYANKLNKISTGHGERGGISTLPNPSISHLRIETGSKTFDELIKTIDRGIILEGSMGAHSGNIPNGDYSIGICPGLYVENGEIKGQVKDAMMAGNIYETLNDVIDIESSNHPGSRLPAILCGNVNVAVK